MDAHKRFFWIRDVMDIRSNDRVLEIGCGVGLAVEAICPQLAKGKFVAIDKSASMLRKARERNSDFIASGRCEFVETDLLSFDSQGKRFNKVLCFNINFFWTSLAEAEMEKIRSLLQGSKKVYIAYGPMVQPYGKIERAVNESLSSSGFKMLDATINENLKCCCFTCKA